MPVDWLSETVLGLPLMPWMYALSGVRKKDKMYPEKFGLVKVTDKTEIGVQDPYLLFPRRFDVDNNTTVECDPHQWNERVSLAYYLNCHILGKGDWGDGDFCVEVDKSGKWRPGKILDLNAKKHRGTATEAFILLSSLHMQRSGEDVDTVDPCHVNLEEDIRGDSTDFIWEIVPSHIDTEHYMKGRAFWKEHFNKEFAQAWRQYAHSQFITLQLLPSQYRQRLGEQPGSEKIDVIKQTQESRNKFKASLDNVLVPLNRQSGLSASDVDEAVKRVSSVLFHTVEDMHKKSDRRHIAGIIVSRNAAKTLLSSLRQLSNEGEREIASESVMVLLNLREHEFSLFGRFSSLSTELLEQLDTISSVSAAVHNLPTKHSTTARHIPITQGQIDRLNQVYERLFNCNAESISDSGTNEPVLQTLHYLQSRLGIVNGTLPGMNPDAGELLWHQCHGVDWLRGKYSCSASYEGRVTLEGGLIIGDAPGLGKTLIVLGFLSWISNWHWRQASGSPQVLLQGMASLHEPGGPIFLVVPVAIMHQWKAEAEKWLQPGSFEFFLYPGDRRERPAWWAQWKESSTLVAKRVVLIPYALLRLDYCRKFETKSADPANGVLAQPRETQEDGPSLYDLVPWMIIADEAHYARNMATNTFRAIHHLVTTARCCILLTATPIHNKLEDMLNLLILGKMRITPILGSIARHIRQQIPVYRARASQHRRKLEGYKTSVQEGEAQAPSSEEVEGNMVEKLGFGKEFLTRMVQVMRYAIGPYYIGRSHESKDWEGQPLLRLPPKTTILRTVQLSKLEQQWYDSETDSSYQMQKVGKATSETSAFHSHLRRGLVHIAAALATSKELAGWIASDAPEDFRDACTRKLTRRNEDPTPSTKLAIMADIVKEILQEDAGKDASDRRKMLIFCAWPSLWPVLEAYLAFEGVPVMLMWSNAQENVKSAQIAQFQLPGPHRSSQGEESWVAVMSTSLSVGVTLTRASVLVGVDVPWSHQEATQIAGRGYRIGQTKPFQIFQLIALGTVDQELLSLSRTKGALMELFTTADPEQKEGSDSPEQGMHDGFWLPDAPVLPPSPEKKKKGKINIVVNLHNDQNMAEASFERRKNALIQYIAAMEVAPLGSDDEPPATPPTTSMITAVHEAHTSPQHESTVFTQLAITDEETSLATDIQVSLPSHPAPTEMTPGSGLDFIHESNTNSDEQGYESNGERPVTYDISHNDESELQAASPVQHHNPLMPIMDYPGEGEQIGVAQTLEMEVSTASSAGIRRHRFRQPTSRSGVNDDEEDGLFNIPTFKEYHERTAPARSLAIPSSQQSGANRTLEEQYSTPSSAGTSDPETLSEDDTDPGGSGQSVTSPPRRLASKKKTKQRSYSEGSSAASVAKSPKATEKMAKKRPRDDDEDSSFQRKPKRQLRAAGSPNQKGKGIATSLLMKSADKIKLRDSEMNALW